jgi:hypothetical protein
MEAFVMLSLKTTVMGAAAAAMLAASTLVAAPALAAEPGLHAGQVEQVRFDGRGGGDWWRMRGGGGGGDWRGRHDRDSWFGPAIGFGAGVAVGSALAAPYYAYDTPYYGYSQPYYADDNADAYCAARFRTYNPATHTYMGYDGRPHLCP